jgi:hypothetical protein
MKILRLKVFHGKVYDRVFNKEQRKTKSGKRMWNCLTTGQSCLKPPNLEVVISSLWFKFHGGIIR